MPTSINELPPATNAADFDAGAFTIPIFAPSVEGLELSTREVIGRTEAVTQPLHLDSEQAGRLKTAVQGEMRFRGVDAVTAARDNWHAAERNGAAAEEIEKLRTSFLEERAAYQNRGQKIGLRAIRQAGNRIQVDAQLVPFPIYNLLATPDNTTEILNLSAATGVAAIVRTADSRLIIQHRAVEKIHPDGSKTRGNASYADIPGASVAGMLDASLTQPDRKPGTPDPIDTQTIKDALLKEAGEELGLAPKDLADLRIVGLAHDNVKPHDELLLLADARLTSEELIEVSRNSSRNKNLGDADFDEKFISIEASPAAIATLLTEVRCPLPPTHAAALVAAGYALTLEKDGSRAADAWKQAVESKTLHNYQLMNEMVAAYYKHRPDALSQTPQRFLGKPVPPRDPVAYAPAYTPQEQGLPAFDEEMLRTGLAS
jgi:hypothetical protein